MSDQNALLQQMLANHIKLLERYQRENNAERVAEWQGKVDKLRAQLGQPVSSPQQFNPPTSGYGAGAPAQQYGAPSTYNPPPANTGGYGAPPSQTAQYNQPNGGYNNPPTQATYSAQPSYGTPAPPAAAQPVYSQPPPAQPTYTQVLTKILTPNINFSFSQITINHLPKPATKRQFKYYVFQLQRAHG